jgi:exopolysaccharide biosynthesis polyprenyl glycosylphosphotransferase
MDFFSKLYKLKIIPFLKKYKLLNVIIGGIDIIAIALAFQLAYLINYSEQGGFFFSEMRLLKLFSLITPFWLVIFYLIQITEIPRTKRYRVLFIEYLESTLLIIILLLVFYFVFKLYEISRLFLIEFALLGFLFLFLTRILEYIIFKIYRAKGYNYINIVLIADESSLPFIENLLESPEWGYRIIAMFSVSEKLKEKYEETIILLPEDYLAVLNDLMEVDIIDEVLYVKNQVVPSEVRKIIRSCEELGVVFRLMHNETRLNLTNAFNSTIANARFLTFTNVPYSVSALALKRIMDVSFSLALLIVLSPLMLFITFSVILTSKGPLIFKQSRVGLRGRQFNLYKFRTMVVNADQLLKDLESKNEMDGPTFKIREDPRITRVGKFLRKTGFDELPQLLNVLKGEMSLIGPRPPLEKETLMYKRWQLRRLSVKPGLSCFWQIKPERNNIKFEKWMELDLAYIDNWSPRLDFIILLKTIKTVFQRSGL